MEHIKYKATPQPNNIQIETGDIVLDGQISKQLVDLESRVNKETRLIAHELDSKLNAETDALTKQFMHLVGRIDDLAIQYTHLSHGLQVMRKNNKRLTAAFVISLIVTFGVIILYIIETFL